MNFQEFTRKKNVEQTAKARALDEICQEQAEKEFNESDWKKFLYVVGKVAIPATFAGLIGSYGGLESALNNTMAVGSSHLILGVGLFGVYKILKEKIPDYTVEILKKSKIKNYESLKSEEEIPINFTHLGTSIFVSGAITLGLAALAKKMHFATDYSASVVFAAGLAEGAINYAKGYISKLEMKRKINIRVTQVYADVENEIKEQEERQQRIKQEREEREKASKERQRRRASTGEEYGDMDEEYRKAYQDFENFFKEFQSRHGSEYGDQRPHEGHSHQRQEQRQRPVARTNKLSSSEAFAKLEINQTVGYEAAKSAFRKLAMKYHPDLNKGSKQAEARFKEVSAAWEVVEKHYQH